MVLKMEDIKQELGIIKEYIIKEFNPLAIILFGSFSRNSQNVESDIDIAIISDILDKKKIFKEKQKLQELIKKDIDLVNLKSEEIYDSLRYEILMNGIVLYCKDEYKYDLYKIDMIREYIELNESRKDIIERIKNGGTIYGK